MEKDLSKILIALIIFFFILGFAFGYVYTKLTNESSSLIYEIKKINNQNNAKFSCSCISTNERFISFTFNEDEISLAQFWNG